LYILLEDFDKHQDLLLTLGWFFIEVNDEIIIVILGRVNLLKIHQLILIIEAICDCQQNLSSFFFDALYW
jgi:hypothetical protein